MCFIKRETRNVILKFREIFPCRETVLRVQRMKSDEKPFLSNSCDFFEKKMVHVVIDSSIFFFSEGFRRFFLNRDDQ